MTAPDLVETRPAKCRFRLMDEGKPYGRSGCKECKGNVIRGLKRETCPYQQPADALTAAHAENERLRQALKAIASCESRYPGDVVDVARTALKDKPDAV